MSKRIASAIMLTAALSLSPGSPWLHAIGGGEGAGSAGPARPVDETRSAAHDGTVAIRTYAGTVAVTGWDRPEVKVTGTLDRDIVRLDLSSSDGQTTIETVPPDRNRITAKMRLSCDLKVMVPTGSSVRVSTLSANLTVRTIAGAVQCDTLGGRIDVAGAPGIIGLRTLNGSISVSGPARRLSFQAMGGARAGDKQDREAGSITIDGEVPEVMGTTLGGVVTIRGSVMKDYDISTLSGAITIDGALAKDGRLKVDAGLGGSIALTLPVGVEGKFTLDCPLSSVDMKGFNPKAKVRWTFRSEKESISMIRVDGGKAGEFRIGIDPPGHLEDLRLPALTLGSPLNEFDVGEADSARIWLELGFGPRTAGEGPGIVLKTK